MIDCVVKLGGSLMQSRFLPAWLSSLQALSDRKIIVVPGGGVFADQVRQLQQRWRFDDVTAHKLALRAMEQYGLVLQALAPGLQAVTSEPEIRRVMTRGNTAIWFPCAMVAGNPDVAASWEITSDSLALWLAQKLHCDRLILVKSRAPRDNNFSAGVLSENGYLDKAFPGLWQETRVDTWCFASDQLPAFKALMISEVDDAPGRIER